MNAPPAPLRGTCCPSLLPLTHPRPGAALLPEAWEDGPSPRWARRSRLPRAAVPTAARRSVTWGGPVPGGTVGPSVPSKGTDVLAPESCPSAPERPLDQPGGRGEVVPKPSAPGEVPGHGPSVSAAALPIATVLHHRPQALPRRAQGDAAPPEGACRVPPPT